MILYHVQPPPAKREGGLEAAIAGLCAALRTEGADVRIGFPRKLPPGAIVHFHGLWQRGYPAAAATCRMENTPYVVSPHGMLEPWAWQHKWWKKWPYFHMVEKRILQGAEILLATGDGEAERLRARVPGTRVKSLPLGLTSTARPSYAAARAALGWAAEERVLLFLSRVHPKKGLDLLLRALATLPRDEPRRLVIVGDGDPAYVAELHALAKSLAATLPPVDWVGAVWGEERWKYFQAADLFCLPTHSENFGLAVLEALQVGTPVLTTRTTPWEAQLSPPEGFICDPAVASIAVALEQAFALTRSGERQRAELAAWTHEQFAWEHLAPAYLALYQSLLS